MGLHDNASTLPWGGALGCRLSLETAILKKPKSYVVEQCNLYKLRFVGHLFSLRFMNL